MDINLTMGHMLKTQSLTLSVRNLTCSCRVKALPRPPPCSFFHPRTYPPIAYTHILGRKNLRILSNLWNRRHRSVLNQRLLLHPSVSLAEGEPALAAAAVFFSCLLDEAEPASSTRPASQGGRSVLGSVSIRFSRLLMKFGS